MTETSTENSPTSKTTAIAGLTFTVSTPYAEGHVCTAAEASVLNQTRAENVGNNLRSKVADQLKAATEKAAEKGKELTDKQLDNLTSQIQEKIVAPYDEEYKLIAKKPGAPRITDPVERKALEIAKRAVTKAVQKKGKKRKDLDEATQAKLLERERVLAARGGEIWKQAEEIVAKENAATEDILDDLDLKSKPADEQAETAEAAE